MQLEFLPATVISTDMQSVGAIAHSPDNKLQMFYVSAVSGLMYYREIETNTDNWETLTISNPILACADERITYLSNAYFSRFATWLTWFSDDRHRVAKFPKPTGMANADFMKGFVVGYTVAKS